MTGMGRRETRDELRLAKLANPERPDEVPVGFSREMEKLLRRLALALEAELGLVELLVVPLWLRKLFVRSIAVEETGKAIIECDETLDGVLELW